MIEHAPESTVGPPCAEVMIKKHHDSARKVFPGSHSDTVPPDSIPNSEVKRISADGSVGLPHVRVGHCQVLIPKSPCLMTRAFFVLI